MNNIHIFVCQGFPHHIYLMEKLTHLSCLDQVTSWILKLWGKIFFTLKFNKIFSGHLLNLQHFYKVWVSPSFNFEMLMQPSNTPECFFHTCHHDKYFTLWRLPTNILLQGRMHTPVRVAVWVKLHGFSGLRSKVREFKSPSFSSSLWLQ